VHVDVDVDVDEESPRLAIAGRHSSAAQSAHSPLFHSTLIMIRHGESELNYNKTFTGWVDADLNERGVREVEHAATLLLERGFEVDVTYTSRLKRAIRSTWILMTELNQIYRPVYKSWRLNERMYGALEGMSKPGLAEELGAEVVQSFRTGLTARPPPMSPGHPHWHHGEKKYADLALDEIPVTESLQDTMVRACLFGRGWIGMVGGRNWIGAQTKVMIEGGIGGTVCLSAHLITLIVHFQPH
jgi:2,3-bisphosphoglycerate-dependent phosphoglycerate mutase